MSLNNMCSCVLLTILLLGERGASSGKDSHGRPRFLRNSPNATFPVGREAVLYCYVASLGRHEVSWIYADRSSPLSVGDVLITQNPRIRVSSDLDGTWSLHIRNVQRTDAGTYMCQINTEPATKQNVYLSVLVPPDILDEESSKDVMSLEGQSARLWCAAVGNPTPTITWKREGEKLMKVGNLKVKEFRGKYLELREVDRTDMGVYQCIASNSVPPTRTKNIRLDVHFEPKITTPSLALVARAGDSIQLNCDGNSFPQPMTYWRGPTGRRINRRPPKFYINQTTNGTYLHRATLVIRHAMASDSGKYMCVMKNKHGSDHVAMDLNVRPSGASKVKDRYVSPESSAQANDISETVTVILGSHAAGLFSNFVFIPLLIVACCF